MDEIERIDDGVIHMKDSAFDGSEYTVRLLGRHINVFSKKSILEKVTSLTSIDHPCLNKVNGIWIPNKKFKQQHECAVVFEYCPYGSLEDRLDSGVLKYELNKILRTASGIAQGLKYLHSKGLTHGNLTPRAILFGQNDLAKVSDFGLAKELKNQKGDVRYMAPEMHSGKEYDQSVDVFAFAVILNQMFDQKAPFEGITEEQEIIRRYQEGQHPKFGSLQSPRIREMLTRCWSPDPKTRPTFAEIFEILRDECDGSAEYHRHLEFMELKMTMTQDEILNRLLDAEERNRTMAKAQTALTPLIGLSLVPPNSQPKTTDLRKATKTDDLESTVLILRGGAKPTYKDVKTALIDGKLLQAQLMVEAGVNDQTSLDLILCAVSAQFRCPDFARYLIEKGADVDAVDEDGNPCLHLALFSNNGTIAKVLIENGALLNSLSGEKLTTLHCALQSYSPDMARYLINKGVDVNKPGLSKQNSPLLMAIENNMPDIARLLIDKGSKIYFTNADGQTPLMFAAMFKQPEIAQILLSKGAKKNDKDIDGKTPLDYAWLHCPAIYRLLKAK